MIKSDEELDKFEEDTRKLKNKYDQFFSGITKMPPTHERHQLEVFIHELGKKKIRENARRFRYQQLLSRYNQYRELWGRRMREREEGPLDFRRRKAAMTTEAPQAAAPPRPRASVTSQAADPYVVKVTPGSNGEEIKKLYTEIEKEHQKLGRPPGISFEQLTQMVEKQSDVLRERYHVNAIAFRVDVVDGKVKLKAKPVQE